MATSETNNRQDAAAAATRHAAETRIDVAHQAKADVTLELIQPVGPQGMIQKFIEKRGAGLHHISIRVDNLEEEMKRLKTLGVQFASEEAAQVEDSKVVFIHPRSTNGLLVELIQRN